jgi:two-component system chemotaxis sensor kinase CheA
MTEDLDAIFREELRDLLESLERGLLDLKAAPDDMGLVNQVFRDLHTIKGSGAMFGFSELAAFIHSFETVFDRIRSGTASVSTEIIRLSLAARDEIPGLVDGTPDLDHRRAGILADLDAQMPTRPETVEAPVAMAEEVLVEDEPVPSWLTFRLVGEALALGARPDIILAELRALGAVGIAADVSDVPPLEFLEAGRCDLAWSAWLPCSVTDAQVEDVFAFVDALWRLERAAPQVSLPEEAPAAPVPAAQQAAPAALNVKPVAAEEKSFVAPTQQVASATTVRVPADRLDALMDSVGELVIVEARLTELARQSRDPALIATAEQITRLAAGLRDATMTMRMVPMRSLVGRFRRLVSELSDKLGKPVRFAVLGEETELDKTLIEKLADPIVHILRNSLDHGLEDVAERAETTKPAEGTIELSAQHVGAEVLIRIRDDGRGMSAEKLRAKGVAQGLISADAVLSEAQLFALIFEPGFSTAAQITEISGRGVGMDVVRRTIESLRGTIEVDSKPGQGTTVTLRMPLTLAIIEGLLIEVAGERYTLPMVSVQEIVELPADKAQPSRSGDFLDVRGRFVPFLRLRSMFDCAGAAGPDQNVVIVVSGESRVGIVVDRIIGTNQTVIKQMSKLHAGVRAVSGATILGDGSVALILDVTHLVGMGRAQSDSLPFPREVAA